MVEGQHFLTLSIGLFFAIWPERAGFFYKHFYQFILRDDPKRQEEETQGTYRFFRWFGILFIVLTLIQVLGFWNP